MMQQYPPQPPPQQFIRPEEPLSVSGDVHRAFRYAMIIGVPLAIGGIVVALLASLAISIPAYVYLVMGVSVVLLSIALIITSYSWFRSLRILEGEIGKINQRLSNLQQTRAPPMQTQPMIPLPPQMQQRYAMPPLPPPYMQQQPQGTSEASNSNDYTQ
jgi:type IV secretory pathway VirB3-like protein